MWISSLTLRAQLPPNITDWKLDEHKIKVFKEQVQGWQLDIANYLLFGKDNIPPHPHAAFAALSILVNYFENIGMYIDGCTNDNKNSYTYFKRGFHHVLSLKITDEMVKRIYTELRCGLYHMGLTKKHVILTEAFPTGININQGIIYIAPTKLLLEIENHFNNYCNQLTTNPTLRTNFEKRFDWLHQH